MTNDRPERFGEMMAEEYDAWYGTLRADLETASTVAFLAEVARGGSVLEFAIGTGRVALPLAATGLHVHGLEASPRMVEKLRAKPGGHAIPVTIGDMARTTIEGRFELVYLIFNTLFNLTSQQSQVRCFQNAAAHLSERGVFVVEAFVPDPSGFVDHQAVRTAHIGDGTTTLEASIHDPVTQVVDYQYVVLDGQGVRTYRIPMRYAWPSELDLMAQLAGLVLRERYADWQRTPFTAASRSHVSVYARA